MMVFIGFIGNVHYVKADSLNSITLQLDSPYITVNGVQKEIVPGKQVKPVVYYGRTLIPIKPVIEGLGGTVSWDGKEQRITITHKENTVILWIGKKEAQINKYKKELEIEPRIIDGYTMVPFRFVAENLRCSVGWNEKAKTIIIRELPPRQDANAISLEKEKIATIEKLFEEAEKLKGQAEQEKYKEIIQISDEVLKTNIKDTFLWQIQYYKGRALSELGMNAEAMQSMKSALEIRQAQVDSESKLYDEKLAGLYYYYGRLLMIEGKKSDALENIRLAFKSQGGRSYVNKFRTDPVFTAIKNTDDYYNLTGVRLVIDDNQSMTKVTLKDGTALASYMEVGESLGAFVKFDEFTQTITMTKLGKKIELRVDSKTAKVDGEEVRLKAAPILIEKYYNDPVLKADAILIPIEFIAETLGQQVTWREVEAYKDEIWPAIQISEPKSKYKYTEAQRKWVVAPSANQYYVNYSIYDATGEHVRFRPHVITLRHALEGFGIYSRDDYFEALDSFKNQGDDQAYRALEKELRGKDVQQLKKVFEKKDPEVLRVLTFYEKNREALKDKGLIAWDYWRIIIITRWSYIAGYLTLEENYDICMDAAKVLQKTYSSWEELAEHELLGFEFWSGQDREDEKSEAYLIDRLNQTILRNEKSLWRTVPWNLDLGK
ncbi:stalk domain-containing protein [Anaerosolibacter carboniphilus]|nr:stalk domain-containing protein [Anaerosolibacter carboniphilus]